MKLNHLYTLTTTNVISNEGIRLISKLLRVKDADWLVGCSYLPGLPGDFEYVWKTEDGKKFTTRVSQYYYKKHGIKVPTSLLSEIGNVARAHSSQGITYRFRFVDQFDWYDGDFGDGGSCFWGSNSAARDMLTDNGALAMCFFDEMDRGKARAWMWLYKADGFWIVWNGYGYTTLEITRVFARFMGMEYRQIDLRNRGRTGGIMWINSGGGYVVGTPEAVSKISHFDLDWDTLAVCYDCGRSLEEHEIYRGADDEDYCDSCFYDRFETCGVCGEAQYHDDVSFVESEYHFVCEGCLNRYYVYCDVCNEYRRGSECPEVHEPEK